MNPDWMGGPDQVREADLQRAGAARQYREADLPLTKLWAYYYGIGGDVDELSLEAYLHEALHLPAVQVGLIVMALAETGQGDARVSGGEEPAHGDGTGRPDTAAALQEAVLDSKDVRTFLEELAALATTRLSAPDNTVHAGVTVLRRKRPQSVASSDATAAALDELQDGIGDGPCLTALKLKGTLLVPDLDTETRWPGYSGIATGEGVHSILAIPLDLDGEADAVLNLYSGRRHGFPPEDVGTVEAFTAQAAGSLRLVLKIAQLNEVRRDLTAAMRSRTVIDMAIGAVMAENRCDRDTAFGILTRASSTRNVKLRDVAASVITSISGESHISTYFDE